MGLSLHIDKGMWQAHIDAFHAQHPGLVPVIKGDGYGLGTARLAHEAKRVGSQTVAVGTPNEADELRAVFAGEILILTPWQANQHRVPGAIHTLSSIAAINAWHDQAPVVVEILTDTRRHGLGRNEYGDLSKLIGGLNCRGLAFHLPLTPARSANEMISNEIESFLESEITTTSFSHTVWVSHISLKDLTALRGKYPSIIFLERVGTELWLGESRALKATATILDRHRISSGERIGYRQRRVRKSGWLLVVAGGTQHGIGLESPPSDLSLLGRIKIFAKSMLVVAGIQRSPYSWNGSRLLFAEPPHMQCSLLLISGESAPEIGVDIDITVRHTTTRFDAITE
jgi:cation transport regulator ChaC